MQDELHREWLTVTARLNAGRRNRVQNDVLDLGDYLERLGFDVKGEASHGVSLRTQYWTSNDPKLRLTYTSVIEHVIGTDPNITNTFDVIGEPDDTHPVIESLQKFFSNQGYKTLDRFVVGYNIERL